MKSLSGGGGGRFSAMVLLVRCCGGWSGGRPASAACDWSSGSRPRLRRSLSRALDRAQPRERGDERGRPWPVGLEAQSGAAAVTDDPAGGVKQPVAQSLGLGDRELTVKADQLRPREEVLGDQRDLQPGLVVLEGVVGEVAHAGVLAGADAVLDPRAAAVAQLQRGDVLAVLVGEEAGVPVAVFVEDRELRAGMRPLAPDDQPGSLGPGGQVQTVVSSATHAPSRASPSPLIACCHAVSGTSRIAARTVSLSS